MPAAAPSTGDVRALLWRAEEKLDQLGTGLRAALDPWARDWGLSRPTIAIENAWQAEVPNGMVWQPLAMGRNGELVAWLGHPGSAPRALECLMFGVAPVVDPPTSLAGSLAEEALAALRAHLVQWLGAAQPQAGIVDALPRADGRPWSGAVRAAITLQGADAGVPFWLHMRASAWPQPGLRSPASGSNAAGLTSMNEALAAQTLKLQARLADVHVSLGELIGLRQGDVLMTGHRLEAPLAITSPDHEEAAVFHGRLVQRQGRMAVTLMQTP